MILVRRMSPPLRVRSGCLMRRGACFAFCFGLTNFCLLVEVISRPFGIEGHALICLGISGDGLESRGDLANRLWIGNFPALYLFISFSEHVFFEQYGRSVWRG